MRVNVEVAGRKGHVMRLSRLRISLVVVSKLLNLRMQLIYFNVTLCVIHLVHSSICSGICKQFLCVCGIIVRFETNKLKTFLVDLAPISTHNFQVLVH